MKEYQVTITTTTVERVFIKAEDEDELQDIINSDEYEADAYPDVSVNYDIDNVDDLEDE